MGEYDINLDTVVQGSCVGPFPTHQPEAVVGSDGLDRHIAVRPCTKFVIIRFVIICVLDLAPIFGGIVVSN